MQFLNDYKNLGGRVCAGSDSGFIYQIYGFGLIRELELLQEAGFNPLEVWKAATIDGAELLGLEEVTGSVDVGKRSEEHTSELQSLMRISYAVFCLKKKKRTHSAAQGE